MEPGDRERWAIRISAKGSEIVKLPDGSVLFICDGPRKYFALILEATKAFIDAAGDVAYNRIPEEIREVHWRKGKYRGLLQMCNRKKNEGDDI